MDVGTIERIIQNAPVKQHAKLGNFWSMVRHSFSNSKFEPVLVKFEKSKPCGAHPSAARSEPQADHVWTVPTSSNSGRCCHARAHDTAATASPPTISATASRGFKRSTPSMSSPLRPFSFAHTQPLLLLASYRH
jgi:hypothetical protein